MISADHSHSHSHNCVTLAPLPDFTFCASGFHRLCLHFECNPRRWQKLRARKGTRKWEAERNGHSYFPRIIASFDFSSNLFSLEMADKSCDSSQQTSGVESLSYSFPSQSNGTKFFSTPRAFRRDKTRRSKSSFLHFRKRHCSFLCISVFTKVHRAHQCCSEVEI